ncbi:MAG TPA: ABC transporter permease [Candidatus Limnocylindrales bacterium]
MTAVALAVRSRPLDTVGSWLRRNAWTMGLIGLLAALLVFTKASNPNYGAIGLQGLAISVLPLALAAVAQAIVVIAGGIDLSIGAMMAFTNVTAAVLMENSGEQAAVAIAIAIVVMGIVLGLINGGLVVLTRVPDIVVTLAMSFVWAGSALLVLETPGGGAPQWLMNLVIGPFFNEWIPKAAVVLLALVAVVWFPLRRARLGLTLYAIGGNPLAAFRSGVAVGRTKILAYGLMGLFAGLAGLSLSASTGVGTPVPGPYTLMSVAAIVLGGVSLAGGRGGVFGPILAVVILQLIRTDMTLLGVDTNAATVAQGLILIGVVMVGSVIQLWRARS